MTDNLDLPKSAAEPEKATRLLPAELGWDKYEPAFQRWAAYNSMQYVAKRDGAISAKEYADREQYLDRWVSDQQRQGKLPSEDEIRGKGIELQELMVPYQKHIARQETEKTRSDRAYWTRIEDFSDGLKENIDTERRYTRMLNDGAVAGAAAYGKSSDQVKGDIQERFTRRYLYTPTEYYHVRLESGDRDVQQQIPDKGPDRVGKQEHKSRSGNSREPDDDRGR
jgi:hypothetical protein